MENCQKLGLVLVIWYAYFGSQMFLSNEAVAWRAKKEMRPTNYRVEYDDIRQLALRSPWFPIAGHEVLFKPFICNSPDSIMIKLPLRLFT